MIYDKFIPVLKVGMNAPKDGRMPWAIPNTFPSIDLLLLLLV